MLSRHLTRGLAPEFRPDGSHCLKDLSKGDSIQAHPCPLLAPWAPGKPPAAGGHLGSPTGGRVLFFTFCFSMALVEHLVASQMKPHGLMVDLWGEMSPFNCPQDYSENSPFYSELNSVNVPIKCERILLQAAVTVLLCSI